MDISQQIKNITSLKYFKIVTLCVFFLKANLIINRTPIMQFATLFLMLWGIAILFYRAFVSKALFKQKLIWLFILFSCSYLVTIFLNRNLELVNNIRDLIWFFITVTLLMEPSGNTPDEMKRDYNLLLKIYVVFAFVFAIASLPFVFLNVGGKYKDVINYGFYANRLFGVYRSPNYGALYSVIAIMISAFFMFNKDTSVPNKVLYGLNILVQYLYICYSGSVTGKICLMVGIIVYGIYFLISSTNVSGFLKNLCIIAVCLVVSFMSINIIKTYTVKLLNAPEESSSESETPTVVMNPDDNGTANTDNTTDLSQSSSEQNSSDMTDNTSASEMLTESQDTTEQTTEKKEFTLERHDQKDGITNGRAYNWNVGLKVFKDYKIFGTSMRSYSTIAKDYDRGWRTKSNFLTLENDFMSLLVCTGISGFTIMMITILFILYHLFKGIIRTIKHKQMDKLFNTWVAVVIFGVVSVTMLVTDAVMFSNTLQSIMFWISLGYAIKTLNTGVDNHNEKAH